MEHMYNEAGEEQMPHGEVDGEEKNKHKEEGEGRRRLDEADRKEITVELEKYSHPLNDQQPALNLLEIDIPGLDQVLGQPGATHAQLQETAYTFFLPLYGEKGCTTINDVRAHSYRCHKKPPPLKKLPPTDANLQLHVLRAHLQMILRKAADQRDPPEEARNIANFGWNIERSAITPAVSTAPVAPQALLDAVSCSCTARCKACSGTRCSCNSAGLSCTDYCKCERRDICCNPFISKQLDIEEDKGIQVSMMNKSADGGTLIASRVLASRWYDRERGENPRECADSRDRDQRRTTRR
ncbi:hypothetical protein NP493_722g02014 [Ridgeia piscesae]|uniref:Tesmin/TSO1-like CXC domain-containing protein n=1 Tax=Ridgeia piscesae TaxID=27915 RepID=A0AAD9KQ38_RIDPI|nr:hypothetical protein NP493_722g02014 [Ridgeia piscesae]